MASLKIPTAKKLWLAECVNNITLYCNCVRLVSTKRTSFDKSSQVSQKRKRTKMKTILVIEDNKDILENVTEYLEMEGYKILAANNGKTGVELATEFIPDLIICDVLMHEMNGYGVLHLLLDTSETHEIPFIFSTSMSEQVDRTEALKLGADDYIVKPFDMELLLQMVQSWIKSGSNRHSTA